MTEPRSPRKPSSPKGSTEGSDTSIDAQAREDLIREAAFLRAERRGFLPGHELDDWLAAERELDQWLATRAAPRRYG